MKHLKVQQMESTVNAFLSPWHLGFDALVLVSFISYVIYVRSERNDS